MSNLKLQILLGAVDKLTAPLKAVSGQSKITAKDLAAAKAKVRDLEKQSAKIDGFKQLGAQLGITSNNLKAAEDHFEQLKRTIAATANPTRMMVNEYNKAERAVKELSAKQKEMKSRYDGVKQSLQTVTIGTKDLTKTQERLKAATSSANEKLKQQQDQLAKTAAQQKKLAAVRARYANTQELRGKLAGSGAIAMGAGTALGAAELKPVIEFAKAETAVTDLKVSMMGAGGQVRKEFAEISELATKLGNRLPGTSADFQSMMGTLIQQGMSAKAIMGGLGEATAYLGVQLKMPYEQAALFSAKLQDATGTAEKDMMGLMDTIQRSFYLGVDSSNMLQAFTKLSPALTVLKKKGLEAANVLAPLIIMADQGGMEGSASGNAFRKIFQLSMNGKKVKKATAGTGISLNFTNGKGEFGGLEKMYSELTKLRKLNTESRLAVMKSIYGDDAETLQALNIMIDKGIAGYRETQAKMAAQADLQQRVNAQLGTLSNMWDAATGTFTNFMVNMGEAIAPEVKAITEWVGELSERLATWSKNNPELSSTIMKVAAVVSVITIGIGALMLAISAILGPIAIMSLAFGTMGITLGGLMLPILAVIAAVAVIAGLAYLIYDNWGGISKWFGNLWDGCAKAFDTFMTKIKSKIDALTNMLPDWMKGSANISAELTANTNRQSVAAGVASPYQLNAYSGPRIAAQRGAGTTNINAPITVNQQPGQSGTDVAKAITTELERRERAAAAAYRASYRDRS